MDDYEEHVLSMQQYNEFEENCLEQQYDDEKGLIIGEMMHDLEECEEIRRRQAKSENVGQSLLGQITGLGLGGVSRSDAFEPRHSTRLEQAIVLSNGLIQKINQETEVKNLKAKIKDLENLLEFQNHVILDLFKQRTK